MNKLINILTSEDFKLIALITLSIILIGLSENPQDYISLN